VTERARHPRWRVALACALALSAAGGGAGTPDRRLVRLGADGAGGGVASGATYTAVLAYGQAEAQGPAFGGPYAFAGGVFATLPADRLFRDGFE
jgi:hypothetical protein